MWIDKAINDNFIKSPNNLNNMQQSAYDFIVLATVNCCFAEEMKNNLLNMGISEKRIVSCIREGNTI